MRHLRVESWVVPCPAKVGTVALGAVVREDFVCGEIAKLARQEERQPFIKDNMLVSSDGELASTVEQPLVLFKLLTIHE